MVYDQLCYEQPSQLNMFNVGLENTFTTTQALKYARTNTDHQFREGDKTVAQEILRGRKERDQEKLEVMNVTTKN